MMGSMRSPGGMLAEMERIQQQLDRVFPRSQFPDSIRATARGEFPAINIGSTPETLELLAFAPGIDPKSVQLTIEKGLLVIAGERATELRESNGRVSVYARERISGPFRRVVNLPEDADPKRVTATYRDGFLRVSVGKRESSRPRQIEINS